MGTIENPVDVFLKAVSTNLLVRGWRLEGKWRLCASLVFMERMRGLSWTEEAGEGVGDRRTHARRTGYKGPPGSSRVWLVSLGDEY